MAAGDGLISMKPTSITHSGTSASINADGGVDFTAVTSLSLNGVFTSAYDNYLIVMRHVLASGDVNIVAQLRAAGVDATASNYVWQSLTANGSGTNAVRSSATGNFIIGTTSSTLRSGDVVHVYGPALAQPTAIRCVNTNGISNARLDDAAGTHSLSTSYDGITFAPTSSTLSGTVHVFGYEE